MTTGYKPPGFFGHLRLILGSLVYEALTALGWQPREQKCEHPDAGED